MPAKNESFLVLEDSLRDQLEEVIAVVAALYLARITKLVESGDFDEAREVAESIDFEAVIRKQEKFMALIAVQALLFGARDFAAANNTIFSGKPPPPEVIQAVKNAGTILIRNMEIAAKKLAISKINEEEAIQRDDEPTPIADFREDLNTSVANNNNGYIGAAAGALVSRTASFGFANQALAVGQDSYRISEVLDSRTCPICRVMDGRLLPLSAAQAQLQLMMTLDDPDQLASTFPWPSQNPESVRRVQAMTSEQIISAGLSCPPFHNFCRGVLVRTHDTSDLVPIRTSAFSSLF